jgi:flagellar biosynthesis protein FlhG
VLNVSRFDLARLRALRRFIEADRRMQEGVESAARVVSIASGKGGTGKSVLASNLACLRARSGQRVLLVDFDAGLANAHLLLLGLAPRYDLADVQSGRVAASEALVEGPAGLKLLSGGVGRPALANPTRRELERLYRALEPLEQDFDLVLVDHGAGMGYATLTHLAATSAMILVTNPEVTALSDAYALYKHARSLNPGVRAGVVINRAPDAATAEEAWARFQGVSRRFLGTAPELIGWVPQDPEVPRSVEGRQPVCLGAPEAPAARALGRVAAWSALDGAVTPRAFYERARRALR